MSQQVEVEVLGDLHPRTTVEVIQQGATRVVEVTRPESTAVVEVLLPGPQGPPGAPGASLTVIDGGTFN